MLDLYQNFSEAANKSVSGESKHTLDIVVAAQEIAASSCQLVVASRVKAPKSNQLQELTQASRNVSVSTGIVVAIAKDCSQRLEEVQDFDFTKLSLHQAKTKEMEIQVKVLELEQALNNERMKLATMRKQNYQAMEWCAYTVPFLNCSLRKESFLISLIYLRGELTFRNQYDYI